MRFLSNLSAVEACHLISHLSFFLSMKLLLLLTRTYYESQETKRHPNRLEKQKYSSGLWFKARSIVFNNN